LPYQRPPLSKKFLSGEMDLGRISLRNRSYYAEHNVELRLNVCARHLNSGARTVRLSDGEVITYDRLVLCLGAASRPLTCPGADHRDVHYLRTAADAESILREIKPAARVVIIGGGYIGLETAATTRSLGCDVTVLEMADRIMNRVVSPAVSDFFTKLHRSQGVNVICNSNVVSVEAQQRIERVVCSDGSSHEADVLIVGIGGVPNIQLAADAGLHCDNGILVDEYCRTSDHAIYAAGDCTNHPSQRFGFPLRLESVDNAFEQARTAALNILDRTCVHDRVPWFWSDQFDHKLLIVGLSQGFDQLLIRGDSAGPSFSVCYLKLGELLAVEAVNSTKDHMAARKLVADRMRPDPKKLVNQGINLKECL
jgi:3-phenylpropionate/trans-cinnamate dioxygenase ferredoxin reductase component